MNKKGKITSNFWHIPKRKHLNINVKQVDLAHHTKNCEKFFSRETKAKKKFNNERICMPQYHSYRE